ncbi:MAG TPA: flagellar FliJ family protein [Polyangiaceae bacterium]|nr:flagellar FliJ family protein [Polyangiaceae bacterium]
MSDERKKRLARLMDVRAKNLETKVADLASARTTETTMEKRLEAAQAERVSAVAERDERAARGLSAGDWGQAENWLAKLAERELAVATERKRAAMAVIEARTRVAAAKVEQDKIQMLMRRAADEARQIEVRATMRLDDEFASRLAGRKSHAD